MKTLLLLLLTAVTALADFPVSGRPVSNLTGLDTIMQDEMADSAATAGVLGVIHNGRIVYLRSFGYDFGQAPIPENALFRIASLCKPVTAAAIRQLANSGALGGAGLQRRVFNLTIDGINNNGLLTVTPFLIQGVNVLGDNRFADITVEHLLHHAGGFRRNQGPGDPMFKARQIADEMGVASPPSRHNIMRWMLGRPLIWAPGAVDVNDNGDAYSNFGYMVLGEIVAAYSPDGSYLAHLRSRTLTPSMWVPEGEYRQGRSLLIDRNGREPAYNGGDTVTSVFDDFPFPVSEPYGGWNLEAMLAHGGLIASAATMLEFGSRYEVWYPAIGTAGASNGGSHTGALTGTSSVLWRRNATDNTVVYAAFNVRNNDNGDHLAGEVRSRIATYMNGSITWPAETCDGFWVSAGSGTSGTVGRGGYNDPYRGFAKAWNETTEGSRIRLKPGNSGWSGTLNRRMRLDAPEGSARIGVQ